MPLAFPSHQGLALPLAWRWPRHFDALALCVGAAMPDVVDGIFGLSRGYLGQWYGHTLIGTLVLCGPGGLFLTWLLRAVTTYLSPRLDAIRRIQRTLARLAHPSASQLDAAKAGLVRNRSAFASLSVWVGAVSHLLWDFISHGSFLWLYPVYENTRVFPGWWYTMWSKIPIPFYEEPYPFGPHLMVWFALTLLGAVLFFRPLLRKRRETPFPRDRIR